MKYILFFMFMFLSSSFSYDTSNEEKWIGTFQVVVDNSGTFLIYYEGNYNECFTKFVIDKLFEQCDSINKCNNLDSILIFDGIRILDKPNIKTKRI